MVKWLDKLLLFTYSIIVLLLAMWFLVMASGWIPNEFAKNLIDRIYYTKGFGYPTIVISLVWISLSIRFLWVILRGRRSGGPSIHQRNDLGQIQVTLFSIEQIALKSIERFSFIRDPRARVKISDTGLMLTIRVQVDGEKAIPTLSQEIQSTVKQYTQEITGIPVAQVDVYIAGLVERASSSNRVE